MSLAPRLPLQGSLTSHLGNFHLYAKVGGFQLEMEFDEFLLHCIGCYLFSLSVLESYIFIFISHGYGEL